MGSTLETGWRPATPVDDTILRRFMYNQADVNAATALALGGRAEQTEDAFLADAGIPVQFVNQAILARPLSGPEDPVLDAIDEFFDAGTHGGSVLSIWPTGDLSPRGWELEGHPAVVLRGPGATVHEPPADVEVRVATTAQELATAERIAIEGFPLEGAEDLPEGSLFPSGLAERGIVTRLGLLDGEPVALGNVLVGHGLTNLCLAATLPAARRRGVWEALVWARVNDAPHFPSIAYTSDHSRPGFISRGFIPITRFTLWIRPAS